MVFFGILNSGKIRRIPAKFRQILGKFWAWGSGVQPGVESAGPSLVPRRTIAEFPGQPHRIAPFVEDGERERELEKIRKNTTRSMEQFQLVEIDVKTNCTLIKWPLECHRFHIMKQTSAANLTWNFNLLTPYSAPSVLLLI